MINILDLLRSDGSIVINKKLAHKIGLDQAIIYSELVSKFQYWSNRGDLVDEKLEKTSEARFFFCTIEDLEESTTIKKDKQNRALKSLEKIGLIETRRMGIPARRYFSITSGILDLVENKISQNAKTGRDAVSEPQKDEKPHSDQISQNAKTGFRKMRQLDFAKCDTNNTKDNNTNINNTNLDQSISPDDQKLIEYINKKTLDGLIDRRNDSESILNVYDDYKDMISIGTFIAKLGDVLHYRKEKNNIRNLDSYLRSTIKSFVNESKTTETARQAIKKDKLPKCLEESLKLNEKPSRDPGEPSFEELLAMRRKQKEQEQKEKRFR